MTEFLIFHLYAPLVSWGDMAVGEVRHTHPYPTKSSILGLVAGAMGIGREEEEKLRTLQETIGLAVMVLSYGDPLRDYHTVQVPPQRKRSFTTRRGELEDPHLSTLLSSRDYQTDALYRVALWKKSEESKTKGPSLQELQEALEHPRYTPYLGRKSCPPALPFQPHLEKASTLAEALKRAPASHLPHLKTLVGYKQDFDVYHDLLEKHGLERQSVHSRKDRLFHSLRRQFTDRTEQKSILRGARNVF